MAEVRSPVVRREVVAGVLAGLVLTFAGWLDSHPIRLNLSRHLPPAAAAAIGLPVTPTPLPVAGCIAPSGLIAAAGFDPYAVLSQKRPDVLAFYAANGWSPSTQCTQIYDNWTGHGAGDEAPTTPVAYVRLRGWVPRVAQPPPTPFAGCAGPPSLSARLGVDPYRLLAEHRPDVLAFYAANGWKPATQCVQLFDDWLKHPDGGPPATAAAFVVKQGWARAR